MTHTSFDIVAVSDEDFSVNYSPHIVISESEGGSWPDHPVAANDYTHDYDLVGPTVVEPNPDLSPPAIASEGDHNNHHKDPFALL